jgi:acyl-CoA thioesterase FadM
VDVRWLESGRPVVEGEVGDVGISLSHDNGTALAVAGAGPQGCDLAPVESRPRERWVALVGERHAALLDRLAAGDGLDRAGTRLWAAIEAVRKATAIAEIHLEVEREHDDSVLFRAGPDLGVLTFPVRLARGPERVVAVVVRPGAGAAPKPAAPDEDLASRHGYDVSAYALELTEDGPVPGLGVVTVRFPLTFRETANLSRTLYYSHVFGWMGKLRELAVQPVYGPLARQFATGRWGMVTNYAETRLFADVVAEDVVEGRFWPGPASGRFGSTQELHFEWRRVLPDGGRERFGWSRMGVTWVEILGHGIVEPRPLPDYYSAMMEPLTPPDTPEVRALLEPSPSADVDLGAPVWQAPPGPVNEFLLHEEVFETSLEESNLVGNVYFANYYVWQGPTRDRWFQALAPELYQGTGEAGEWRCLYCRVDHLREAMPFHRIAARMALESLNEHGVVLRFDYFRLGDDGSREKLATGRHVAGWFVPAEGGHRPGALPAAYRTALLGVAEGKR